MASKQRISLQRLSLYNLLFLVLLAVAAVGVSRRFGLDLAGVWESVRTVEPGLYLCSLLSFYAGLVIRAWRWRLLIKISADPDEDLRLPSVMACTRYVLIGRFADSVSFARVGNLYRAYLAHAQGSSFPRILGTTAAESVLDMVMVYGAVLGVGTFLSTQNSPAPTREAIVAASAGAGLLILALLVMRRYGLVVARLFPALIGRAYAQFHRGALGALGGHRQMPLLCTLTALGWLCAVARWYMVAGALGIPVSFTMMLFVSLANAVIAAIPATPGGLGLVEPGVSALLALQMPMDQAISLTLSERFISYVSVVVAGGVMFLSLQVQRGWGAIPPPPHHCRSRLPLAGPGLPDSPFGER